MSQSTTDACYTMGYSKDETERLIHQSELYESITERFLHTAGVLME